MYTTPTTHQLMELKYDPSIQMHGWACVGCHNNKCHFTKLIVLQSYGNLIT